ncbi:polysaccharide export outer membrane protein [Phaeovulum vinaykumarii]|uniref:Polysaccharide export outer membrane protein n=2 Tax=Phaeovulum vinaykumarii TaxID=407234 RepID=A0A1N7LW21_9RHOB|nr:polysaccharide export outer membrane protein [Phaeovulum vinaykumarii]SOC07253.1 polysaccharide export outer membrane protein [Phaeovulum vinaykumarii]
MNILTSRGLRLVAMGVLVGTTASCALPRSGPSKSEIYAGSVQKQGDAFVLEVNDYVTRATAVTPALGFSSDFRNAGQVGSDTLRPGDTLGLTIWENVDDGLLAPKGANATQLTEVQIDGAGFIFVPYAGRIKAAGNSPEALRRIITEKLDAQTPDPQVTVMRVAGDGATVSVMGAVSGQGVYAIERPTRTLSSMLARAGGVSVKPEIARVTVTRGAKTGTIWLKDLYENPAMDIALRPGDVILVEEDTRAFTAMGATGAQARVPFDSQTLSALEAIATVGGLNSNLADPKGVFVLRNEPAEIANTVLGRSDLQGAQRMVYVLDLTKPNGLFLARDFVIRDGDTVYVTEAPYVTWQKSLSALTGPVSTVSAFNNLTGD